MPSGLKAASLMFFSCPRNTATSSPLDTSQMPAVGPAATTTREPSGLQNLRSRRVCRQLVQRLAWSTAHPSAPRSAQVYCGPRRSVRSAWTLPRYCPKNPTTKNSSSALALRPTSDALQGAVREGSVPAWQRGGVSSPRLSQTERSVVKTAVASHGAPRFLRAGRAVLVGRRC